MQRRFAGAEDRTPPPGGRGDAARGTADSPSDSRGLYAALGLTTVESRRVDAQALHAAFRRTVVACHPDTAPAGTRDAAKRFRAAVEAWEVLREPARRRRYDQGLSAA